MDQTGCSDNPFHLPSTTMLTKSTLEGESAPLDRRLLGPYEALKHFPPPGVMNSAQAAFGTMRSMAKLYYFKGRGRAVRRGGCLLTTE